MEIGRDRLNFLDVTLIVTNDIIEFNWYQINIFG